MGNSKSKNKRGPRGKAYGKNGRNGYANDDEAQTVNEEEYEDIELLLMRKTIERNPENFVLNNLMMCVQFFRNYEEYDLHLRIRIDLSGSFSPFVSFESLTRTLIIIAEKHSSS